MRLLCLGETPCRVCFEAESAVSCNQASPRSPILVARLRKCCQGPHQTGFRPVFPTVLSVLNAIKGTVTVSKRRKFQLHWFLPGFDIKRWLVLLVLGGGAFILGLAVWLNLQPITWLISALRELALMFPSSQSGPLLMVLGLASIVIGLNKTRGAFRSVMGRDEWLAGALEHLYRRHKLDRGPRIVAIGGGTGLSTLLRGLKRYTNNITAIVTVGDDGGSSGRLREEQGIIPPGDIRNCIAALADEEQLLTELFQYRFRNGQGLGGHSFGNLFLTALCQVTGDMVSAIKESSKVLNVRGRVLPSTLDLVSLVAEMKDGSIVRGESLIPESGGQIARLSCDPAAPLALPESVEAIQQAELIVLGPGSLYTSVIPNLLIDALRTAIIQSPAPKVYVCNVMTQPGETDGYSVANHIQAILSHTGAGQLIDAVVVNDQLPQALIDKYESAGCQRVELDRDTIEAMGVDIIQQQLVSMSEAEMIRHDSPKLARSIVRWFKRRTIKHHPPNHQQWQLFVKRLRALQPALRPD